MLHQRSYCFFKRALSFLWLRSEVSTFASSAALRYAITAKRHIRIILLLIIAFIEDQAVNPATFRFLQTAGGYQDMEMSVEIQTSSEGVWYHHNRQANAILELCPLANHRSSKLRQAMQEMAVLPKDWPEEIRHRKHDAYIRNIGESAPPVPLP